MFRIAMYAAAMVAMSSAGYAAQCESVVIKMPLQNHSKVFPCKLASLAPVVDIRPDPEQAELAALRADNKPLEEAKKPAEAKPKAKKATKKKAKAKCRRGQREWYWNSKKKRKMYRIRKSC